MARSLPLVWKSLRRVERGKIVFWKKGEQAGNLGCAGRRSDTAGEVTGAEQKKSKGFGEVSGWCVEIRTGIATEPRRLRINTTQFHPSLARLLRIESDIDGVAQFVRNVVCQQTRSVLGPSVNLDP